MPLFIFLTSLVLFELMVNLSQSTLKGTHTHAHMHIHAYWYPSAWGWLGVTLVDV